MPSLMKLGCRPTPITCIAALATLAPIECLTLHPLASKGIHRSSTRGVSSTSALPHARLQRRIDFALERRTRWRRQLRMTAGDYSSKDGLYLFDFDGVICDSCDECTVSAWRTCKILNAIGDDEDSRSDNPPQWLFHKMREIRPAIEVGWQIPVLLSVFLEQKAGATPSNPAMTVPEILQEYEVLVDNWLKVRGLEESTMIKTFGQVRDSWIGSDLKSWLSINTFYYGISQGITDCPGEAVLVTTKQQRFATSLVRHAGIEEHALPTNSIYGLGMYKSKSDVIVDRMHKGGFDARNTHFFEDRWPTIAKCLKDDRLEMVKFYLCSWGYCTEDELQLAEQEARVEVLTLDDFAGVVTG